jgi:hypothetical protein
MFFQLHEILCTDSQDMLVLVLLHHPTTTAVQVAAPVPERTHDAVLSSD